MRNVRKVCVIVVVRDFWFAWLTVVLFPSTWPRSALAIVDPGGPCRLAYQKGLAAEEMTVNKCLNLLLLKRFSLRSYYFL